MLLNAGPPTNSHHQATLITVTRSSMHHLCVVTDLTHLTLPDNQTHRHPCSCLRVLFPIQFPKASPDLCEKLVGHSAHHVDGRLLGLDDVSRLGVLGQALEGADERACQTMRHTAPTSVAGMLQHFSLLRLLSRTLVCFATMAARLDSHVCHSLRPR